MKTTREATQVYFSLPTDFEPPSFSRHSYQVLEELSIKPFKSQAETDPCLIWNLLDNLYKKRCTMKKSYWKATVNLPPSQRKMTWAEQINRKRQVIAGMLRRQTSLNFAKVCRSTGCDFETVKSVYNDLLFQGQPCHYDYQNQKAPEDIQKMDHIAQNLQGTYQTVSDIKRELPNFSKKKIAKTLRQTGLRWRQLVRKRKNPKEPKYSPKSVVEVVSHLTQAMNSANTILLYVDEVHFPLVQTASHHWTKPELAEELVYNRRFVPDSKLSAIALCSLDKFIAVQVFKQDITMEDFLYFIQTALSKYKGKERVTILADNATWHTSSNVVGTRAGKFLHFNVKGLFQSNIIENAFSFVRSEFRKRKLVETVEEEAQQLIQIFFDPRNEERFKGIRRNHLRSLMTLLMNNCSKLSHINSIPKY